MVDCVLGSQAGRSPDVIVRWAGAGRGRNDGSIKRPVEISVAQLATKTRGEAPAGAGQAVILACYCLPTDKHKIIFKFLFLSVI